MTNLPFTINGVDFSDVVHKYGYATDSIPVYSRTITTLDGVDHCNLIRMRGVLTITTNPVSEARAAAFCSALQSLPAAISYYCFQTGKTVTQTMRASGMPLALTLQNGAARWLSGMEISFEQL